MNSVAKRRTITCTGKVIEALLDAQYDKIPFTHTADLRWLLFQRSAIALSAQAAEQKITGSPANIDVKAGATDITVELVYSVTDNQQTTGASAKIFYDSKALVFKSLARADDLPNADRGYRHVPGSESLDTGDLDGDDTTDSFANIAYSDFGGEFPDAELLSDGSTLCSRPSCST